MQFERLWVSPGREWEYLCFNPVEQESVVIRIPDGDDFTPPEGLVPYKGQLDHPDYCGVCHVVGGYCGQCGGGYWQHNWEFTSQGYQPTEKHNNG